MNLRQGDSLNATPLFEKAGSLDATFNIGRERKRETLIITEL
jgi:hypothetical protein